MSFSTLSADQFASLDADGLASLALDASAATAGGFIVDVAHGARGCVSLAGGLAVGQSVSLRR